jgi:hypothetical protein
MIVWLPVIVLMAVALVLVRATGSIVPAEIGLGVLMVWWVARNFFGQG